MSKIVERLNNSLPSISTPMMEEDNLAIVLCTVFDDGREETADDTGWSIAARNGYEEVIAAIRNHYKPAADTITRLTARVEELERAAAFTPTHRHKARGSVYQEIGIAELQSATRIQEGAWLTIYRAEDGRLWARPTREFRDGRFEVLPRAAITKGERTPSFGDFVEGCDYLPVPSTKGESND